ncbi:MAG: hypothetical protein K2H22_05560, partial [Muribaculaceae bacterium]|nr:hypothetical protein [Muribaculaceae bacterium]
RKNNDFATMKTTIALTLTMILMAAGCGQRNARETLREADRLVNEQPDSAIRILEKLDTRDVDPETQAWHALLLAKANEKALKRFHNDSLTEMAAEYFRGHGDSLEIQALYYNGVILGYNKDYASALISLIEAAKKANDAGDDFYCGMAYREQADIYRSLMVESKHLEYADSARHYFDLAKKPVHAIGEELSLAEAMISLNRADSALKVLESVRLNPEMKDAPAFNAAYHRAMANARLNRKEYLEAINHLDSVEMFALELTSAEWSKKARIFCAMEDYASATRALEEARIYMFEPTDSTELDLSEAILAAGLHDYRTAYEAFNRHYGKFVDSRQHLLTHPYTAIVSDYYKEQSERRHEELGTTRRMMWMAAVIAILLTALIIAVTVFYRRRLREKADQSETLVSDIDRLQKIIDRHNAEVKTANNVPAEKKQPPRHYSIINSLCELSSCVPETSDGYAILGKNVTRLVSTLHSDETISGIENFVNDYFDNIMSRFRDQYPGMTERNYRFAMLSFADFSIQSITTILELKSTGAARTMRHRIKKHIEEHPAKDQELFLSML